MNPNPYAAPFGNIFTPNDGEESPPQSEERQERRPLWEVDPRIRPSMQDAASRDPRIYPHVSQAQQPIPEAPHGDQLPLGGGASPYGGVAAGQYGLAAAPAPSSLPWGWIALGLTVAAVAGGGYWAWKKLDEEGPIAGEEVEEDEEEYDEEDEG